MSTQIDIRILELLSARLCHELISPVGAINNGVELLGEEDPEFVRDAVTLVGQSAKKAAQRLQFYRFAYGTLGGGSAGLDPRDLLAGLLDHARTGKGTPPDIVPDAPTGGPERTWRRRPRCRGPGC